MFGLAQVLVKPWLLDILCVEEQRYRVVDCLPIETADNRKDRQDGFATELHLAGSDGAVFHVACGGESLLVDGFD